MSGSGQRGTPSVRGRTHAARDRESVVLRVEPVRASRLAGDRAPPFAARRRRGARIAEQLCPTLVDRRETAAQIAAERRSPGGVVNLSTLHDPGEKLQYNDAMIAKLSAEYTAAAKAPFTELARSRR